MGMFDNVLLEYALPDADAALVKEWQTKSLDDPVRSRTDRQRVRW